MRSQPGPLLAEMSRIEEISDMPIDDLLRVVDEAERLVLRG